MCCQPDHVGPDPEWYADTDGIPLDYPRTRVSGATLAAWARLLEPRAFDYHAAPVSTEGGTGRALPTTHHPPPPPSYRPPVSFTELATWNPTRRIERAKRKGGRT